LRTREGFIACVCFTYKEIPQKLSAGGETAIDAIILSGAGDDMIVAG